MIEPSGAVACAHSTVAPHDVTSVVERSWDVGPAGRAVLVSYGINDHYVQETANGRIVVRVYQHGWRTDDEVLWELELVRHLRDAGAPVAAVRPATSGALAIAVDAPEGPRQVAVFDYAIGRDTWSQWMPRDDASQLVLARRFGAAVGAIHRAADSFASPHERFSLDLDHLVDEPMRQLDQALHVPPAALEELHDAAAAVRAQLEVTITAALDWGACHGDLHGGNASGGPDAVTLYDFDCGGWSWRAYDLGVLRWSIATSAEYFDVSGTWPAVLDGYTSERQLSDADLEATVPFAAARQLWFYGIHARNSRRAGYGWQGDMFFNSGLRFLRRWRSEGIWV